MGEDYKDVEYEQKSSYRRGFLSGILAAVFIVLATLLVYTALNLGRGGGRGGASGAEIGSSEVERKTERLKELIDKYYLNEVNEEDMVDGMYMGLMYGLGDPYTVYYTEEELTQMLDTTEGRYAGIGAQMSQNMTTGLITIVNPFENGPAFAAGIRTGDILLAVDGEDVGNRDLSAVVTDIKGEAGTEVVLTVLRGEDEMDITVTRDIVEVQTVSGRMLTDTVGYISILEFDAVTTEQFKDTIHLLQSEGMEELIVDLRDNPGGSLNVVIDMLDYILPEGLLVYTEDKYGNREEAVSDAEHVLEIPMAVLVNENSASAAEIFAGAVKDYGWGTLVGTTTYGKGIVQQLFELGDGTAVKITVSKYYTPNGNDIHGVGIAPDVEAELPPEVYEDGVLTEEEDVQLQEALRVLEETNGEAQ